MSTQGKPSYLRREDIVGKSVVGKDAMIVGTVKDLAVSIDGKVALQVEKKNASPSDHEVFLSSDEIHAVGDVVLLKYGSIPSEVKAVPSSPATTASSTYVAPPPFPGSAQGKQCSKCNYVNSANSRFCIKCGSAL